MWQPEQPPSQTVANLKRPLLFLPGRDEEAELGLVVFHFGHRGALAEKGAGGTGLHAFAARGATGGFAPWLVEIGDDPAVMAAPGDIPGVRTFDFIADAHATGTENAAVVIDAELIVRHIHGQLGKLILEPDVIHAHARRQVLQFAMAVGHAHRANVVAFGEQQFDDHLAIFAAAARCRCARPCPRRPG